MGGVLKTSYQSVLDTGNIQKTRQESGAPPTTEVSGLRAWLRMKSLFYRLSDDIIVKSVRHLNNAPVEFIGMSAFFKYSVNMRKE